MEIQRYLIQNRRDLKNHIPLMKTMCDYFTPLAGWLDEKIKTVSDVLYAVKDDMILGYVIADNKKTHLEIELICVGPEGRTIKGIGTRLMQSCEKIAMEYGLPEIRLEAQFQAVDFYKKLRFIEVSRDEHGVVMKKTL